MQRLKKKHSICPEKLDYDNVQEAVNRYNEIVGDLTDFDCPKCKNKGYTAIKNDKGVMTIEKCECLAPRRAKQLIRQSGINADITFNDFKVNNAVQKMMLERAKKFLTDETKAWFYIGGQNGVGKSLLCTAIVSQLLAKYIPCKYMLWSDESLRLKALVNSEQEYLAIMDPLQKIPVLYIDDFFKTEQGKMPTSADIMVAFRLLNHRYLTGAVTIISCERSLNEIIDIDEAVGSRIGQKAKDFNIFIEKDKSKNYRFK